MRRAMSAAVVMVVVALGASAASAKVLLVGSWHGISGGYTSIQAAVDKAKPGDWVLVGPGDYKEHSGRAPKGRRDLASGVLMTTRHVYLRGMNRNTVIVDGTKPGSKPCSNKTSDQNFGPGGKGLNGLMVWKADNVWIENLTACNYLAGKGDTGNEIWWNGGDGTLKGGIGGHGMVGRWLNATSTFFKDEPTAAKYGIFSSNWNGGLWDQTYASNFNDSSYYIGACMRQCNQVVDHAHGQFSALGYSGSNSGGRLVVRNSEFDNNEDGFDTNSQNGDNPAPQDGSCPAGVKPPVKGAPTCWVFVDNFVHDNNNPNVPSEGAAAAGPVGTGMSVSGGRNDTIMHNRFVNNNAWGIILVPFVDSGPPCTGGTPNSPFGCLFDEWGNAIINNTFSHNGSYGHPSNGDFAQLTLESGHPNDCYSGNTAAGGGSLTPDSAALQTSNPTCTSTPVAGSSSNPKFLGEVLCDSQVELNNQPSPCPTGQYPRRTKVVMHALPKGLKTMPNPCAGVPANPWCKRGKPA